MEKNHQMSKNDQSEEWNSSDRTWRPAIGRERARAVLERRTGAWIGGAGDKAIKRSDPRVPSATWYRLSKLLISPVASVVGIDCPVV